MYARILNQFHMKFKKVSLTLLIAVLTISVGCKQDRTTVDPEPIINLEPFKEYVLGKDQATENFSQLGQTVAALADGSIVTVWSQGEAPQRDVMLQWLKPNGDRVFGDSGEFVSLQSGNQDSPTVVAHPTSGAYICYRQSFDQTLVIMLQYFDSDGNPVWPQPIKVVEEQNAVRYTPSFPALLPDQSGGVYVCFNNYDGFTTLEDISVQRIDSKGNRLWGDRPIIAGARAGMINYPCAVTDGEGGLLVFWRNMRFYDSPATDYMFYEGQHINATGEKLWGEQSKIVYQTSHPFAVYIIHGEYKAESDGKGGAILAMQDWLNHDDDGLDVVAQRVSQNGELIWGNGVVVNGNPGSQTLGDLISTNDGGAFILVHDKKDPYGFEMLLYLMKISPDGNHQFGNPGIRLTANGASKAEYWANGHFKGQTLTLTWTQQLEYAATDMDIILCRLNADGTFIDPQGGFVLLDAEESQLPMDMVFNTKSNTYFVIYEDTRESKTLERTNVYGAHFKPDIEAKTHFPLSSQSARQHLAPNTNTGFTSTSIIKTRAGSPTAALHPGQHYKNSGKK
jgi:hypothetical protein